MAEQGAERFVAKLVATDKVRVGLRHVEIYPNVKGRTKGRIVQSQCAHACSLAIFDKLQVARSCILRAFLFIDAVLPFSDVTFFFFSVLFCFVFVFFAFRTTRSFVRILRLTGVNQKYGHTRAAALSDDSLLACFTPVSMSLEDFVFSDSPQLMSSAAVWWEVEL